jgi:hypothetical protein
MCLAFAFLFSLSSECCHAQWKLLVSRRNWFRTVYFLDLSGPPRIGFAGGSGGLIMKTTDGGTTWKDIYLPLPDVFYPSDFYFKDSLNGWLSTAGDATRKSGCYQTSDGGETWSFIEGSASDSRGMYCNEKNNTIFLANWNPRFGLQSFDNGLSWSRMPTILTNGFAFNDSLHGSVTGQAGSVSPRSGECMVTSDAGLTWQQQPFDSECWQPLAIRNSKTQFVITDCNGIVYRTDDMWQHWKKVYAFPIVPTDRWGGGSTGCIRGDSNKLFVQIQDGVYMSTNQGLSWKYLCGQPSGGLADKRFYFKDHYLFIPTIISIDTLGDGYIWSLDLDSLFNYQSEFRERIPSNQTRISPFGGDTVLVTYSNNRGVDTAIAVDSIVMTIRYDSNNAVPIHYESLNGWSIQHLDQDSGIIRVVLVDTLHDSFTGGLPLLNISYRTYLSSTTTKIYLDSVRSYAHRVFCDCDVASIWGADSVELNFQYHCGDSILMGYLLTGNIPFSIESVVPNPARDEIRVNLRQTEEGPVSYQLLDALGRSIIEGVDVRKTSLQVGNIPSDIYYLRLSQGGFTKHKKIVVEH